MQHKLQEAEVAIRTATVRAEKAETRAKKIEDRVLLAKTIIGKWLDAKDDVIQ